MHDATATAAGSPAHPPYIHTETTELLRQCMAAWVAQSVDHAEVPAEHMSVAIFGAQMTFLGFILDTITAGSPTNIRPMARAVREQLQRVLNIVEWFVGLSPGEAEQMRKFLAAEED